MRDWNGSRLSAAMVGHRSSKAEQVLGGAGSHGSTSAANARASSLRLQYQR